MPRWSLQICGTNKPLSSVFGSDLLILSDGRILTRRSRMPLTLWVHKLQISRLTGTRLTRWPTAKSTALGCLAILIEAGGCSVGSASKLHLLARVSQQATRTGSQEITKKGCVTEPSLVIQHGGGPPKLRVVE